MGDDFTATSVPKNKVVAATGGAAIGTAVSVILVWGLQSLAAKFSFEIPKDVSAAFGTIFTTLVTLAAGYYTPPGANEGSLIDATGRVRSALK